jgi:hypothetical protein
MEAVPRVRTLQLGDVPAPQLIGTGGQKLRPVILRMPQLITPFPHRPVLRQNTVHRPHTAQVRPLVQQLRPDLAHRLVAETFTDQRLQNPLTLGIRQPPMRPRRGGLGPSPEH